MATRDNGHFSIAMVRFYSLWIFKIFKILKFLQQWFENFRNYGKNFGKMATRDNGHFSIAMVRFYSPLLWLDFIFSLCYGKIIFSMDFQNFQNFKIFTTMV